MRALIRYSLLVALTVCSISAFAKGSSDNVYVKINVPGERAKIVACPSGACLIEGVAPGKLTISVCDAQGKPLSNDNFKLDMTFNAQSVKTAKLTNTAAAGMEHEVVSPRDPASGQATGKRMHKPFVITKELDKSTPLLALTTPNDAENDDVTMWTLEVRVQKIEMK